MINLMLGSSGSGKSYESTVFHILPALKAGRKVITNLPVNVAAFAALDHAFAELIELRTKSRGPDKIDLESKQPYPAPVFSHPSDYGCEWRNDKGQGALYVIDECHKALPRAGTDRKVDEWFAEHRHENADVLLITQSYGKVSKAITDNVQMVYRCRKAVAFGSMGKYIRKVQDGVRGEVVNTSMRSYDKKFFGLYTSHTKGVAASEIGASDVRPLWKHWSFLGAAGCFILVGCAVASGKVHSPWAAAASKPEAPAAPRPISAMSGVGAAAPRVLATPAAPASAAASTSMGVDPEPYADKGLHVVGRLRQRDRDLYAVAVSQNGQYLMTLTSAELERAGYVVKPLADCALQVAFGGKKRALTCDLPVVGPHPPGTQAPQGKG